MFPLLHGSDDLTLVILSYVNPEDLHNTIVNHATLTIIRNNRLWKDIFERDFHKSQLNLLIVDNDFDIEAQGYRQAYIESYRAFKYKMLSNMDQLEQIDIEMRSHSQLKNKLNWIDAFQFRIMLPLPFLSITLTCLLFALKLDNISNISYLACFLPLILFVSYFFGCLVYTAYQSKIQDSVVWQSMAGPLRVMFSTRIANQPGILFSAVLLLLLQLILLVLKFSTPTLDVSWGLIFLPLWLLSALFCLLPVVQCTYSPVFCTGLLLWIPLFVLFVCLAVKLNKEEHGKKSFLLAEILVPFWLLEVFFLIATVLFVVQAYHTVRAQLEGSSEYFHNVGAVCMCSWLMLLPIIVFQILISLKDAGSHLTYVVCVIPLLLFFGLISAWTFLFVAVYRTPYQEVMVAREQSHLGRTVIWDV